MLDPRWFVATLLAVAACGGSHRESPPAQPPTTNHEIEDQAVSRTLSRISDFTSAMCTCQDAGCAMKVEDLERKWELEELRSHPRDETVGETFSYFTPKERRLVDLYEKMYACMTRTMSPPTP
jgi:hypothetical protein